MEDNRPMSVVDWMLTLLILAIPLLNIIMYLYWAFSNSGNVNRKNFCIASLIWFLILCGIGLIIAVIGGFLGMVFSH